MDKQLKSVIILFIIAILLTSSVAVILFNSVKGDSSGPDNTTGSLYKLLWSKSFGDDKNSSANCVTGTPDGGYILTGFDNSYGNNTSLALLKVDASGNKQWNKSFGDTGETVGYSVVSTGDGGYAVTGYTSANGNGGSDVYLLKTDSSGNKLWDKNFGGASNDFGYSIARADNGDIVIAGSTYSSGHGGMDVYLIKTDKDGNQLWNKTYGGPQKDGAHKIIITKDGTYLIGGFTKSFGNMGGDELGNGAEDLYLINTDSDGNVIWNNTYGGNDYDDAFYILQTTDDGYAVAGQTKSFGNGMTDGFLIKTSSSGDLQWNRTYGGYYDDAVFSMAQTRGGEYVLAGTTYSTQNGNPQIYIVKTDSIGNELGNEYLGGQTSYDLGYSIAPASDNGFIIAGSTSSAGDGSSKMMLIKIG